MVIIVFGEKMSKDKCLVLNGECDFFGSGFTVGLKVKVL